jgi:hypothetical protein
MAAFAAPSRGAFWLALVAAVTMIYCALYEAGLIPFVDLEV